MYLGGKSLRQLTLIGLNARGKAGWPADRPAGWLAGWLAGWSPGRLADWLAVAASGWLWLAGWLAGSCELAF